MALLGAFLCLAELGIVPSLCDSQRSQTVGFGDYKASTSRFRGSLPPRRASGVLSRRVTARGAKLVASCH